MATKKEIRTECLSEILEQMNITATPEQIGQIVDDFSYHIEMEGEMDSYQHVGGKEKCTACDALKEKLAIANREIAVYNESVKKRRGAYRVWIENGEVRYEC